MTLRGEAVATAPKLGLVLDCIDPERLAAFWAAALDYVNVGSVGAYVALYPRSGGGPKLLLQRVEDPKSGKNRMHVDIDAEDIRAEGVRLERLGATRIGDTTMHEHATSWIVMPSGGQRVLCLRRWQSGTADRTVVTKPRVG